MAAQHFIFFWNFMFCFYGLLFCVVWYMFEDQNHPIAITGCQWCPWVDQVLYNDWQWLYGPFVFEKYLKIQYKINILCNIQVLLVMTFLFAVAISLVQEGRKNFWWHRAERSRCPQTEPLVPRVSGVQYFLCSFHDLFVCKILQSPVLRATMA